MGQGLGSQLVARACREVAGTVSRRQSLGSLLHCRIGGKQLVSGGRLGLGQSFQENFTLWRREIQCVEVSAWPMV